MARVVSEETRKKLSEAAKGKKRGPAKDLTGQAYNQLTFLRPTEERKSGGKIVWELQCTCGNVHKAVAYAVISGETVSCGCWKKEFDKTMGERMAPKVRKHDPHISSARARWMSCYRDCEWELFYRLSQMDCHYCGRSPHRTCNISHKKKGISEEQISKGVFTYNGLDRLDSSLGHIEGNVVPCCWDCNHMKGRRTVEEFVAHIKRIVEFFTRSALPEKGSF